MRGRAYIFRTYIHMYRGIINIFGTWTLCIIQQPSFSFAVKMIKRELLSLVRILREWHECVGSRINESESPRTRLNLNSLLCVYLCLCIGISVSFWKVECPSGRKTRRYVKDSSPITSISVRVDGKCLMEGNVTISAWEIEEVIKVYLKMNFWSLYFDLISRHLNYWRNCWNFSVLLASFLYNEVRRSLEITFLCERWRCLLI